MEILSRKPAMIADPACIKSRHSDLYRKGFQRRASDTDVISARFVEVPVFEMGEV
jgi:hypothetical protein